MYKSLPSSLPKHVNCQSLCKSTSKKQMHHDGLRSSSWMAEWYGMDISTNILIFLHNKQQAASTMYLSRYIFNTNQGCMNMHEFASYYRIFTPAKHGSWIRSSSRCEKLSSDRQAVLQCMKGKIFSSRRHHHSMHPWILTFKFLKCLHFYDGYVSTPKHKLQMIDSQPPRMMNQQKQKNNLKSLFYLFYSFRCLFIFLFGHLCQLLANDIPL